MATDKTKELEELTAKFNALCDEQEKLPREGFAKVFEVLAGMEDTFTPDHPYTENEDIINKALGTTGHSNDEAFCRAFKRNNQIMIEGKKIQAKGLEIFAMLECERMRKEPPSPNEWQFIQMRFVAPEEIIEDAINPILERDASEGKGLFANETEIEEEDEDEDALLMVEAYNCKASFIAYRDSLREFGVIGIRDNDAFFSYQFTNLLLKTLRELGLYISQNTDNPARTKNHIRKTVKAFDKMPVWGLFFQILILQGLCKWLLSVNIKKGDNGYDEAKSLNNWLYDALYKKLENFCYVPYGDNDKIRLKPLCDYLYSTEIGKAVQREIFSKDQEASSEDGVTLPKELNTERARKYFAKAINAGYMRREGNGYKWLFGNDRGRKVSLGYFILKVYSPNNKGNIPEKAVNQLFGIDRIGSAISQIQCAKKPQKWREDIDILFE